MNLLMFLTLNASQGPGDGPIQGAGVPRCAPVTLVSLGSDGDPFEVSPKLNYKKTIISTGLARVQAESLWPFKCPSRLRSWL